jgi:MFS family permease
MSDIVRTNARLPTRAASLCRQSRRRGPALGLILLTQLVTRAGARLVLTTGLLGFAVAQALFLRLPVSGGFAANLLRGFLVVAVALGLAYVGDFIASAAGTSPDDAGLASGLINTSQQVGGAIGLAVTTTVAASHTAALLRTGDRFTAALNGGLHEVFAVTGALAVASALIAAILIRRGPTAGEVLPSVPPPRNTRRARTAVSQDAEDSSQLRRQR